MRLLFTTLFVCQPTTHAAIDLTCLRHRKVSDILKKVTEGHGADFVRVIIQPANPTDFSIDSTLGILRRGKHPQVQELCRPRCDFASSPPRLSPAGNDVSYVSLNRDVIPMGHLSSTTGTDQIRNTEHAFRHALDGTGVGIAIIDSGIDTDHRSFPEINPKSSVRVVYSEDFH